MHCQLFRCPSLSHSLSLSLSTLQIWKFSLSFANYCITFCHNMEVKGGRGRGRGSLWHLSKLNAKSKSLLQLQQHFGPFSLIPSLPLLSSSSLPSFSSFPSSPSLPLRRTVCLRFCHHQRQLFLIICLCRRCLQTFDEMCAIAQCRLQ